MRILGKTGMKRRERAVRVGTADDGSPLELMVRAPRLTLTSELDAEIPPVTVLEAPVIGVRKDPRGRALKDDGGQPIVDRNTDDPAFRLKLRRRDRAWNVALVLHCLGDQVQPVTRREEHATPTDYYMAVLEEMEEFGLDAAAMNALAEAAAGLAAFDPKEFEEATRALGMDAETQLEVLGSAQVSAGK